MTLDEEWAIISRLMYGQAFIDELAAFLQTFGIRTILECGCGDGDVLKGLGQAGFDCFGIDSSEAMIRMATENNRTKVVFRQMNWLDTGQIAETFDCVICRGNSLPLVAGWGEQRDLPSDECKRYIEQSLEKMLGRLGAGGLLYLDTTSERETGNKGGKVVIDYPGVHLEGEITYDWGIRTRRVYGHGSIYGEDFDGGSTSYLITPGELEEMLHGLDPTEIFRPKLVREINYDVICAIR